MRSILISAILLLTVLPAAKCQWKWVHPQPCGNRITSMTATDSMHVWMTGTAGTLIYTRDGGRKWEVFQSDSNEMMVSVCFVDSLRGWISAEHGAIYNTRDGGRNWTRDTIGNAYLKDITFTDSLNGWLGTLMDDKVYHTVDGGISWHPVLTGLYSANYGLAFPDPRHGWLGGYTEDFSHTSDGGLTWQVTSVGTSFLWSNSLQFIDSVKGSFISDYDGKIHYTLNGGQSWSVRNNPPFIQSSMFFTDKDHGWLCGFKYMNSPVFNEGRIARTTNGGKNFTNIFSITGRSLMNHITASDSLHAWSSGYGGMIYATRDGGLSWQQQAMSYGDPYAVRDIAIDKSDHTAWAVGSGGFILKTTNDGNSWVKQESGTGVLLSAVHFFNANDGIAVGDSSIILRTGDGGDHWNRVSSSGGGSLTDLCFQSPSHGWMTSYKCILETKDGGMTWDTNFRVSEGTGFISIEFADSLSGLALGNNLNGGAFYSQLLRTTDGGISWQSQLFDDPNLNSVSFPDPLHGFMCGSRGEIMKSSDGGISWNLIIYNLYDDYYAVHFTDSLHGWVVGDGSLWPYFEGIALYTDDGGATWTRRDLGVGVPLYSVSFTDPDFGYVTGEDGAILRWGINTTGIDEPVHPKGKYGLTAYPNPSSGLTILNYSLPASSKIRLSLYNDSGICIRIIRERFEATGMHSASLEMSSLPAGVYLCKLQAKDGWVSVKIIKK